MANTSTKRKAKLLAADLYDRHVLYESAVQSPDSDIDFIRKTYKQLRKRMPVSLREDFCGTALACCEWVKRNPKNTAIGVDFDREVLGWGRDNHLVKLSAKQQARLQLIEEDVLKVKTARVDVLTAFNFSYWIFEERELLTDYFRKTRQVLNKDGVLMLDAYGGYETFQENETDRDVQVEIETENGKELLDYVYTWEQRSFNPIDHHMKCAIHFHFEDGSSMIDAFNYEWRVWTLPELKEILLDAGYRKVTIYVQGFDKDGDPDGNFKPAKVMDADAGWISYIVAEK